MNVIHLGLADTKPISLELQSIQSLFTDLTYLNATRVFLSNMRLKIKETSETLRRQATASDFLCLRL
jgi:hypothetical protein